MKTNLFYRLKDPIIDHAFPLEINSKNDGIFNLNLLFRSYNAENKNNIYEDQISETIKIDLNSIYQQILQNSSEKIIKIFSFSNQNAYIKIAFSLNQGNFNLFEEKKEVYLENEFLTNDLIDNFHKTLNEINQNLDYQPQSLYGSNQKLTFNETQKILEKNQEIDEIDKNSPTKLEKTMV